MRLLVRFLLVGTLLLTACNTTRAPDRWAAVPVDQKAMLFGTMTADISSIYTLTHYEISYRNLATGETASFNLSPQGSYGLPRLGGDSGDPELYESGKMIGRLFEMALPAGEYEFFQVRMVNGHALGSTTWTSKAPFSLRFTVKAGTTHYIGEIRSFPLVGKSRIGMLVPTGGYFVFLDREARDSELLTKRRGEPLGPVVNIKPDTDRAATPFLRKQPLPPFMAIAG